MPEVQSWGCGKRASLANRASSQSARRTRNFTQRARVFTRVCTCVGTSPFNSFSIHGSHNVSHLHGFQLSNYLPMTSRSSDSAMFSRTEPTRFATRVTLEKRISRFADFFTVVASLHHARRATITSSALSETSKTSYVEHVLHNLSG